MKLTTLHHEVLVKAVQGALVKSESRALREATEYGLVTAWSIGDTYSRPRLTLKGEGYMRTTHVMVLQITYPDQPPLILLDPADLIDELRSGNLAETVDLTMDGDCPSDGLLFNVEVHLMLLHEVAVLPEWEAV